jgi:CubicO group peptidase (beta-lactamase class C family)
LTATGFLPLGCGARALSAGIAATEQCPWRGKLLVGEVHDENAWIMGGVSGHAGLFSTAEELVRFGAAWLAALRSGHWLTRELATRAIERRPSGRGLGGDLKGAKDSSAGTRLGLRTFGHLGFTGCSLWVDPDLELAVCLLTNRVHPTRENEKIREFRPAFHDVVIDALTGTKR